MLFQQLATRFVVEGRLMSEVLRRATEDLTMTEFLDCIERLAAIYDVVIPERAAHGA